MIVAVETAYAVNPRKVTLSLTAATINTKTYVDMPLARYLRLKGTLASNGNVFTITAIKNDGTSALVCTLTANSTNDTFLQDITVDSDWTKLIVQNTTTTTATSTINIEVL